MALEHGQEDQKRETPNDNQPFERTARPALFDELFANRSEQAQNKDGEAYKRGR
jgi:hypothetical protein